MTLPNNYPQPIFPSDYERVPYVPTDPGSIDVVTLFKSAGLDPAIYATKGYILGDGLQVSKEVFSDGEIIVIDRATGERVLDRSIGQASNPIFYKAMKELRERARREGGELAVQQHRLEELCGTMVAKSYQAENEQLPEGRNITPSLSDNNRLKLTVGTENWVAPSDALVLEFGPGLVGREFIDLQIAAIQANNFPPFVYIPITDGPFVHSFLHHHAINQLEKFGVERKEAAQRVNNLMPGGEDGMVAATARLIGHSEVRNSVHAIICAGVHLAGASTLEYTLTNSALLLHPEGRLFIVAPIEATDANTTPFDKQVAWASAAGLEVEAQGTMQTGGIVVGIHTAGYAVLRHQSVA